MTKPVDKKTFLHGLSVLPKEDQIRIVLSGFMDPKSRDEYSDQSANLGEKASALTVTPEEIRQYVRESDMSNFLPIKRVESSEDGTYIVEKDGVFHVYDQERGIRFIESTFDTVGDAFVSLAEGQIEHYIKLRKHDEEN